MSELKTCPFCGGESSIATVRYTDRTAKEQDLSQDTFYYGHCMHCCGERKGSIGYDTYEASAAAWNKRVTKPMLITRITPDDAGKMICPFTEDWHNCATTLCMAWRWSSKTHGYCGRVPNGIAVEEETKD